MNIDESNSQELNISSSFCYKKNDEKDIYNKLNNIREIIENMDKQNQIEILRILSKYKDITINENKYGIHINLSELKIEIIKELIVYINYVKKQEIELTNIELEQENYKNIFSKEKNISENNIELK